MSTYLLETYINTPQYIFLHSKSLIPTYFHRYLFIFYF